MTKTNNSLILRILKLVICSIFQKKNTTYFLLFSFIFFFTNTVTATNYYISSSGNDANVGTSSSFPWKTLDKVNSITPKPGDQILFKSGDEWTGTIKINASGTEGSPIIIGSYGTGNNPIITGFTTINSGWKNEGGGIYSKYISTESSPQMVTIDGVQYAMGRWPNTTWRTITGVSGGTQISDSGLTGTPNWTGAEVVIRKRREIIDRNTITSHNTTQLNFSALSYSAQNGWGYFIQNSLSTLDTFGEWYYNPKTSTFYMYFGAIDPATKTVKVSSIDKLIYSNGSKYVTINGLSLSGSNVGSIYRTSSDYIASNFIIQNCDISFSGTDGAYFQRATFVKVTNTTLTNTNNNAIFFESDYGTSNNVNNCTITNTGTIPGLSVSGDGNGIAIKSIGKNGLIEYNKVINSGYIAIYFGGQNTIVRNNFIDTCCTIKDDGGGIYCFRDSYTGKQVLNNIVKNAVGAFGSVNSSGTPESTSSARGLYADQLSSNITFSGNTLYNISASGLHMTGVNNITITNNTIFQAYSFFDVSRIPSSDFISNLSITNNIVVSTINNPSKIPHAKSNIWYSVQMYGLDLPYYNNDFVQEVSHLGFIDSNYYYSNTSTLAFTYSLTPNPADYIKTYYTNDSWKSKFGFDIHSTFVTGNTDQAYYRFEYNATTSPKTISLGNPMIDVKGVKYSKSITLQPYTSTILMKDPNPDLADLISPVITSFLIPTTSSTLTVAISSFTATDNIGVTGYLLTESISKPSAEAIGWSSVKPTIYTFTSTGSKTLYAWVKDASNNISDSFSDNILITLSTTTPNLLGNTEVYNSISTAPNRRAIPVTFSENGEINSISIYHSGGTGNVLLGVYSDEAGLPLSRLGVTESTIINSTEGWQTVSLSSPVPVTAGQTIWLSFVFQNLTGVRYTTGTSGRALSTATWSAGMPTAFGTSTYADYNYSIYCNYNSGEKLNTKSLGNTEVYNSISTAPNRRAIPVTFSENGEINSISIYHGGGTGNVLLGVYSDEAGLPLSRLGVTESTIINSTEGWQTVSLSSPVPVTAGQTIWLSFVFQNLTGVRYTTGTSGRALSTATWSAGMPTAFGTSTYADYNYSIYCNYNSGEKLNTKSLGNTEVYNSISTAPNRRAIPVTFSENGEINSISIYHGGGTGNVLLGVYSDEAGLPLSRLGVTESTIINSTEGWQTVPLSSPVPVTSGQTIWLSFIFQNLTGVRYTTGKPGRALSTATWSAGMPTEFGTSTYADYNYSIYCNYNSVAIMPTLDISSTSIPLIYISGTSTTFNITSNTKWSITDDVGWLSVSPVSGINNGTINVTSTSANTGANPRTAIVTITGTGVSNKIVTVTQDPKPPSYNTTGNSTVYSLTSAAPNRRAIPVTFSENGEINSISIYHSGGTGSVLLGVYSDQAGLPSSRLGLTESTVINSSEGWQTVSLSSPVPVTAGQTIWLTFVFQNLTGVRYTTGTPGRALSTATWSAGMPTEFGTSTYADYNYSIYCTYTLSSMNLKIATIPELTKTEPTIMTLSSKSDDTSLNNFKLYPNPAKSIVNIDYIFMPELETRIIIFDGTGRTVLNQLVNSISNCIDISRFPSGTYYIKSINRQWNLTKKLIIIE
ncbi:MAG: T9SS type A sorting domain-containing protein [Prolixibacteraceae bacterium]|nr:T9SS type A sorting domain-containing protein [Prolixibacteraceae bacterium]